MYLPDKLAPETKPPVDAIGERLLKAAEIIEQRGWCQNTLTNSSGAHCALGAIGKAIGKTWVGPIVQSPEARRFRESISGGSIADYNDAPGRTKDEVIAALKAAARS